MEALTTGQRERLQQTIERGGSRRLGSLQEEKSVSFSRDLRAWCMKFPAHSQFFVSHVQQATPPWGLNKKSEQRTE